MSLTVLKDHIKSTAVSQIIGQYISLRKNGANSFIGLCPFHSDSKPSLNVSDEKGMFMCFACGTGGDAITFVEKFKNYDFVEALKEISQHIGLNFSDFANKGKANPSQEMAKKLLTKVTQIYQKFSEITPFSAHFEEFVHQRKLSPAVVRSHQLGFAPNTNVISQYLNNAIKDPQDKKLAFKVALQIGLIKKDKKNSLQYFDTFRDRIMFPIWDQFGQTIGFTSRAIHDYQKAKYMNSLDSFIFNKKNILYGFHLAKPSLREKDAVIIVEGNMDQIALYQQGIKNVVATQGLGIGDYALQNLKRITHNFFLCLDSDPAGIQGARRINHQCLLEGIIPKFIDLKDHKDPDEFLLSQGATAFEKIYQQSPLYIDAQLEKLMPNEIPQSPEAKLTILKEVFNLVSPLKNDLKATERVGYMAQKLELNSEKKGILEAYGNFLKECNQSSQRPHSLDKAFQHLPSNPTQQVTTGNLSKTHANKTLELNSLEKRIITELIGHPQSLTHEKIPELLDFVHNSEVKRYVSNLVNLMFEIEESEFPSLAMNELNREGIPLGLKEAAGAALYRFKPISMEEKVIDKFVHDLLIKIKEHDLINKKKVIKLNQAKCTDPSESQRLLLELIELERKLKSTREESTNTKTIHN